MDPSIAALLGAGIGAAASLLGSLISHLLFTRREREQWARDRKVEREKWLRDKLHEIYANCIYYIGRTDYEERNKWLNMLLIYRPEVADFSYFHEKLKVGSLTVEDIIELAARDPRLQGNTDKPGR